MGLAFLACKAADTIADTELIPKSERLKLLDAYQEMFARPTDGFPQSIVSSVSKPSGGSSSEKALIEGLPALMEALSRLEPKDWLLIQELVLELTQGMQKDLEGKPTQTLEELDQYIYFVAGCVGKFWTKMMKSHFSFSNNFGKESEFIGEKIGKGLQLVNILRDIPQDLKRGRSYIPKEVPISVLFELAKNYLKEYERYCSYFPWFALRLKAVVRLPVRLGFQTLQLLETSKVWPKSDTIIKVSKGQVYKTLIGSFLS